MEECPYCGSFKHPDKSCAICGCIDNQVEFYSKLEKGRIDEICFEDPVDFSDYGKEEYDY